MNKTMDDVTDNSALSGLSILNDDTDPFYQRSRDYLRRDRQRLRDAASQPQAFRRARPVTLSMDSLDRRKAASDSSVVSDEENASSRLARLQTSKAAGGLQRGAPGTSASQNIPKEWGRKGRQSSDFLRRINSTGDMDEQYSREADDTVEGQDSPLSSKKPASRIARPGPRVKRSIDDLMDRERRERTQSPNHDSPTPASPEARHVSREIDTVKDQAVTSRTLADVAKRSLRMPNSLSSAFRRTEETVEGTMSSILGQLNYGTEKAGTRSTHDTTKSAETVAVSSREVQPAEQEARPRNARGDSRELLRRFARASTASPSPSPAPVARSTELMQESTGDSSSPVKTPPRDSKDKRHSVHGALSPGQGVSSLRSSPSVSRVPTRSSSLRSLQSPQRRASKRQSKSSISNADTAPEDIPIISREEAAAGPWLSASAAKRHSLPALQEPIIPEQEHPDPLRSHPVSPVAQEQKPLFGGLLSTAKDFVKRPVEEVKAEEAWPTELPRSTSGFSRDKIASTSKDDDADLDIDNETLELLTGDDAIGGMSTEEQEASKRMARSMQSARGGVTRTIAQDQGSLQALMTEGECPNCHEPIPRMVAPTLWDVLAATVVQITTALAQLLVWQNAKGGWRPTRQAWLLSGFFIWLFLEARACRVFCPHFNKVWFLSYTDLGIRSPRFPFVMPWKLVLEPTQEYWRPPWETMLAFVEPRGWGLFKRTLWWSLKQVRLDWLFGPGEERLEGLWDWPYWWTYFHGWQYGIRDVNCIMCPRPGA